MDRSVTPAKPTCPNVYNKEEVENIVEVSIIVAPRLIADLVSVFGGYSH